MKSDAVAATLSYLMAAQVADHVNPETGTASNDRLRSVFTDLLAQVHPTAFFDIGARDGESALAVKRLLPDCRSYAFEANPRIHAQFSRENEASGLITYVNTAMGDRQGSTSLYIPRVSTEIVVGDQIVASHHVEGADTGRSSLLRRTDPGAEYDVVEVPVTTLDDFCKEQGISKRDRVAVWIDVEGAASQVIAGARKTLARASVVFVEVEGHAFWDEQATTTGVLAELIDLGLVPIARDREYFDMQFNVVMVRDTVVGVALPALFDRKSALSHARRETLQLEERVARLETAATTTSANQATPVSFPPLVGRFTPVLVPTFNNPTFTRAMVDQLTARHLANIVILDNASTYPPMLDLLDELDDVATVRRFSNNAGPRRVWDDRELFDSLPQVFAVTDPDLELSATLPADFVEQLFVLGRRHRVGKAGFALDISDPDRLRQDDFLIAGRSWKIWEWEAQFWEDELEPKVFRALIDTTFAVYNKEFFDMAEPLGAVRVAGDFTCSHLPWHLDDGLPAEESDYYRATNRHSFYLPHSDHGPPLA